MTPNRPSFLKRALRVLLWLGAVLLVLIALGLFIFDRFLREKYEPALANMQKKVTEDAAFFCEQQSLLAAEPWFHEPRPEGDAGPLLNAWVQWRGVPTHQDSPLAIPAGLPQRSSDFKDWLGSSVDVSGVDFAWMQRLHAFDRWDFLRNAPVPPQQPFNMVAATIPELVPFQLWAKFRLLHGLRTGQPLEAARDVRQLAWLISRTDTVLGGVVAATLLNAEREAYQSLPSPPPEWRPMSLEQVERMKALFMSSVFFSNPTVPPAVARKLRNCGEPAVTRCTALAEGGFLFRYLRPLAQEQYREAYASFAEDLSASPCPTSLARTIWESGVTMDDPARDEELPDLPPVLRKLPRLYFGPHIVGFTLVLGTTSERTMLTFREQLSQGAFKSPPAESPATGP